MRDQELGMIKIDQRLVVEYDLGQFLVDRHALRLVGHETGVFKRFIGFRVGIAAVILRRLTVQKYEGVAVRIDTSAPGDEKGLKFSSLGLLERGRELKGG